MPYIAKEFIEDIQDQTDLVGIISDFVELKKSGTVLKGLSPFSKENTPSFTVSPAKQIWKDFSTGIGGNNAISFLMEKGYTYPDAIKYCADKLGKQMQYDEADVSKEYLERKQKQNDLRPVLKATLKKYIESFTALPATHPAKKEVLEKRGYSEELAGDYGIGYAPGNKFIYTLLSASGRVKEGVDLAIINDKNNDRYWERVIYPVYDHNGELAGLAGRDLTGDKKAAKWINSSDTPLYDKSKIWYGLHIAKQHISRNNCAWITEGYNDVIAWQTHGLPNTIAPCGTAITTGQIELLKRYCSKVIFAMDGDKAGKASVLKYTPEFIKAGFTVEVCQLPDLDPDDYVRTKATDIEAASLLELLNTEAKPVNGFRLLLEDMLQLPVIDQAGRAKDLCGIIAAVEDESHQTIYLEWLAKEGPIKIAKLKSWVADAKEVAEASNLLTEYLLPKGIKMTDEILADIKRYAMFQARNRIYIRQGSKEPFSFAEVSNFSIEIIQHMQDEKHPMKLLRVRNVFKMEKIFDVHSDQLNTPQKFDDAVTAHGNFLFTGDRKDHLLLRAYLFDKMGTGRKIDVMGWQPEGFFAFNNRVIIPQSTTLLVDENGLFEHQGVSYYLPSANSIYKNNPYKYEPQKKFRIQQSPVSFQNYAAKMVQVHREHGINALMFTVASIFQDVITKHLEFFPMLFLYGPASTGKDKLTECCQAFFGRPQTAINLEGGNSTATAQIREFAQFTNAISHLSEYKRGDAKLDGTLKGIWDRRGKKMGNIESRIATDSVPILSSAIITGNDYPDNEALITRLIWNEITKSQFTDEEEREFNELADWTAKGISSLTEEIIHLRPLVEENFQAAYRVFKNTFKERVPDARSRMVSNMSVMGAMYQLLQDKLQFPFSFTQMVNHFQFCVEQQVRKLNSSSLINRFWDCFLASMRGNVADQIRVGRDFKMEGGRLFFQFTSCYMRVQRQWFIQYRDAAPGKATMMDMIRKDGCYVEDVKSTRFDSGANSKNSSALVVDITAIPISGEIKDAIEWQLNESTYSSIPPATPLENKTGTGEGATAQELPFTEN